MTDEELETAVFAVVMADGRVTIEEIAERIGADQPDVWGAVVRLVVAGRLATKTCLCIADEEKTNDQAHHRKPSARTETDQ